LGKILSEASGGLWQLVERSESIADHSRQIQSSGWLIQGPKRFSVIGVEFKELANEPLRNLRRR
jgi:hypothetical protein